MEHVAKEILVQVKISMMAVHSDYSLFIMCHLYTSKTISATIPCHMFWLKLKSLSEDYFSSGDRTSYYYCILERKFMPFLFILLITTPHCILYRK